MIQSSRLVTTILALLLLTSCATRTIQGSNPRVYSDEISPAQDLPGIIPQFIGSGKESIFAFSIHGMGAQTACEHMSVANMFAAHAIASDPSLSGHLDEDCGPIPTRIIPVCLSETYRVTSEATHDENAPPLILGRECQAQNEITDWDLALSDGSDGSHIDRSVSRFGLLFYHQLQGEYVDADGNAHTIPIDYFGYWWNGDAADLQAPFVEEDIDPPGNERGVVNELIKRRIINEGLVDAALYNGAGRNLFIDGTRTALCLSIKTLLNRLERPSGQGFEEECAGLTASSVETALGNKQVVLLSRSLGSRILFDALTTENETASQDPEEAALSSIAQGIIERDPMLYMSANQLPLLGISNMRVLDEERTSAEMLAQPTEDAQGSSDGLPSGFLGDLLRGPDKQSPQISSSDERPTDPLIIAFYDPNDLLGYRAAIHLSDAARQRFVEVTQNYAVPFPFLGAWPVDAHDQSFTSAPGSQLVMCGATLGSNGTSLEANAECRRGN